jgi:hypothetical protein
MRRSTTAAGRRALVVALAGFAAPIGQPTGVSLAPHGSTAIRPGRTDVTISADAAQAAPGYSPTCD